jgi:hypothetical protein
LNRLRIRTILQKSEFDIFKKFSILAHSAQKFPTFNRSKKIYLLVFNIMPNFKLIVQLEVFIWASFWDESGAGRFITTNKRKKFFETTEA